jgi:hypothetical protein
MKRFWGLSFFAAVALGGLTLAGCPSSDSMPITPPSAPTGLMATPANSAVSLTWTAVSGATSYDVHRATATGALATKSKVGTTTTGPAYTDAVANDVAYYYQVTASNSAGASGESNEVSATALATLPPATPTGVTATAGNATVKLDWSLVPNATYYNVYWSTTPGVTKATGREVMGVIPPDWRYFLTNGTTYYYVVTAGNGNGESSGSLQVTATPRLSVPYINALAFRRAPPALTGLPAYMAVVCSDPNCVVQITNATVTFNGTTLAYANGRYAATSPAPSAGAPVNLSVTIPPGSFAVEGTYTASGTMYSTAPTVTSPTATTTWTSTVANTVTWLEGAPTTTIPASEYLVGILDPLGIYYPAMVPISSTSYIAPASSISTPGTVTAWVGIATEGTGIPIPNTQPGSGLGIVSISPTVTFTVQ